MKSLSELLRLSPDIHVPAWMPIYDIDAVLRAADDGCGYASDMMVYRFVQSVHLRECQAVIDMCVVFSPYDFGLDTHYFRGAFSWSVMEDVIAMNALNPVPSYHLLLMLMVERDILIKKT
ncbi:hypothetical protein [Dyella koreensis]|uniref:Uncharacterized protein n=1 Tax=Dyella koreensis TaxID=311235 RepID=A0ABW8K4P6_9GAMM